jgi:hypothetical protein
MHVNLICDIVVDDYIMMMRRRRRRTCAHDLFFKCE